MEINKVYKFKDEFCVELGITVYQVERRLDDLLAWLTNFFDFEYYEGKPKRILVKEIIGEYQPLPRKLPKQDKLNQEKSEAYEKYTIAALGTEFKPNSKSRIARFAIDDFGAEKYGHTSVRAVANRYIKKPFDAYGETNNKSVWVWYNTYEPVDPQSLERWRIILAEEHISEREAANAFYRQEQGEDISTQQGYYKKAQSRLLEEFGDIAVLVREWRCKNI